MELSAVTTALANRFDELHALASVRSGGLSDFGDTDYHAGLCVLLAALDADPMGEAAQAATESVLVDPLIARLTTEAQWQANPCYRDREISRPLIVVGIPRTGTTALHNLLSQDPQFQGIEKWLCDGPMVRPAEAERDAHPQYQACAARVEQMFAIAPEVMKAHGVLASDVDECLVPMAQSFTSNWFPSNLDVPAYDRWFFGADETPSFRRYKDMLRLVGLNDDRPWLLKNPSHVFGIDALLAVFPDACIVQTHRDPVASLASLVNILGNIMIAYTGQDIDRPRRLARETAFWAEAMQRTMAAQDRQPERFVNIFQHDIRRDPLGVVRSIYSKFGLALSADAEQRMTGWAARNAQQAGEGHQYEKIADPSAIREAFGAYLERYGF